ncbi:hypothetical protein ACFV0C_28980 [Streptomyces sp. NPDC059568]|uniref:hypothetical protein n=1 Tax=Streptomyces sp. NPDC059568 TaxID=3346868 RepID=UPI0036A984D7
MSDRAPGPVDLPQALREHIHHTQDVVGDSGARFTAFAELVNTTPVLTEYAHRMWTRHQSALARDHRRGGRDRPELNGGFPTSAARGRGARIEALPVQRASRREGWTPRPGSRLCRRRTVFPAQGPFRPTAATLDIPHVSTYLTSAT